MKYHDDWDLSTIPDAVLRSEWGRRTATKRKHKGGGIIPSCTCGVCRTCRMREYQRKFRQKGKKGKP